jgi:RimJ/RimL family protein N-acetyltransferase
VGSVLQWARSGSVERVKLWVTDGNAPAQRLYQRFGFEQTGVRKPLPSNPASPGWKWCWSWVRKGGKVQPRRGKG